ncbi:MAG: hypothetical protein B7Y45_06380 [Sphingomonas sp. 28-66-16]|nr:MAG: hypothetical protein B7Y45_06380 [Sphingomonas sp. 28-66-16]
MTAKDLYENCRSWLQFAETKNGFALAFCGAVIAAEVSLLSGVEPMFKPFVLLSMLLMTVAAICSLISFVPQDKVSPGVNAGRATPKGIVFFGHIAMHDGAGFVARASQVFGVEEKDSLSIELLDQCHTLSVITVRKLRLFYASVVIAGLGFVLPLVAAAGRWIC